MSYFTGSYKKVLEPKRSVKYHLSWAKRGCVWICVDIDHEKQTVVLQTPKSKKRITAKFEDLRHTRKNQNKGK